MKEPVKYGKKFTHALCSSNVCMYNYISPSEYCQECISCPYLKKVGKGT